MGCCVHQTGILASDDTNVRSTRSLRSSSHQAVSNRSKTLMTLPKPMLAAAAALSRSAAGSTILLRRGSGTVKDDGIARVSVAVRAMDQGAPIDLFDGGDRRTKPDRNAVVTALRCEKFDERAVATDDAPLRMMSANHPFVAKRQGARPLRIRRVVAFGHPLDGTPQRTE